MGFLSPVCKDRTWRDIGSIPSCLFLVLPPKYNCCVKPGVGGQALSRLGPKALACPPLHPWAPLAQGSFPWKWKVGLALGPKGLWRSPICFTVLGCSGPAKRCGSWWPASTPLPPAFAVPRALPRSPLRPSCPHWAHSGVPQYLIQSSIKPS